MPALDKVIDKFVALYLMADQVSSPATATVASAATAVGATTMTLSSASTFTNSDQVRIGTGETMEIATIASGGSTTGLTFAKGLTFAHAVGEPVVEMNATALSKVEAAGFTWTVNGESTDVFTADSRLAYTTLTGYNDIKASFPLVTVTADNVAYALGIPRSFVIGDGTVAAQSGTAGPRYFATDGTEVGTATNAGIIAVFVKKDGTYGRLDLFNTSVDPTGYSTTVSRGALSTVPVSVWASHARVDLDTGTLFTPQTVVATNLGSVDDVMSSITSVSTFTDGTATTTTSAVSAGAYTIPVTATTGMTTAGTIIKIGSGDLAEWHEIHSNTSLTLNLRTQVKRAFASGVAVTVQTPVAIQGIVEGFTLAGSGSATPIRSETSAMTQGITLGNLALAFNTQVNSFSTANLMLALGLPSSALNANQIAVGDAIATAPRQTLMFKGKTKGNKNVTIMGWQGTPTIDLSAVLTQASEARIGLSFKPNGVQFYVNA